MINDKANRKPILSIYVSVYNHKNYIKEALNSILMQKTDYEYEVLVGDDASTDGTTEILKEYEKKYPSKFTMILREKNINDSDTNNFMDLQRRCRGKYMICLEGDDYWTDERKIDKQIDFLENHPDYIAVAHNCVVVDEKSQVTGEVYPECKDQEYTLNHLFNGAGILPGQLTTIMHRNYYSNQLDIDFSLTRNAKLVPGDRVNIFTLVMNGKVYCMQETMSAYRHITESGNSFSAQNIEKPYVFERDEILYKEFMNYAKKHKRKKEYRMCKLMYFKNIKKGYMSKQISFKEARRYSRKINHRISTRILFLKYMINQKVLKTKMWI